MRLKKLLLINFKNITQADINLSDGINCFVGDNGAGKTNILDAIYYLAMSKSAFTMTDGQSVHHGEDFFVIEGSYLSDNNSVELVNCSFSHKGGKVLKSNGTQPDVRMENGLTPLQFAAEVGAVDCVRALLEAGADADLSYTGLKPLGRAAVQGPYCLKKNSHRKVDASKLRSPKL